MDDKRLGGDTGPKTFMGCGLLGGKAEVADDALLVDLGRVEEVMYLRSLDKMGIISAVLVDEARESRLFSRYRVSSDPRYLIRASMRRVRSDELAKRTSQPATSTASKTVFVNVSLQRDVSASKTCPSTSLYSMSVAIVEASISTKASASAERRERG